MKHSHWTTTAAAFLALTTCAPAARTAPVPGEKSPLAVVPASAPLVIHLSSPQALRDHVVGFLKNALPDHVGFVQQFADMFLENGWEGRKLRGLAKDGSIFIVLMELPKEITPEKPPKMAIIASITNYMEFRDNILTDDEKKSLKTEDGYESTSISGTGAFFVNRKDYAVVTPYKDVAALFVQKGTGAPGMDGTMSKAQAAKFLASDLGVYLSMDVFNKQYADQIKAAREGAEDSIKQIEQTVGKAQQAQFEMIKKVLPQVFQAVEDSKGALLTLEARPGGVSLHVQSEVRTGTPTADLLKGSKMSAFPDLGKLPAGDVFYSGMEIDPALLRLTGTLLSGLSTDPNSKGAKAFTDAFDAWVKSGPSETLAAVTYPIAGVSVTRCDDPEKLVAASVKMLEAMGAEGGLYNVTFKEKPVIKPNAEKYQDVSFTSVHMVWDFDKMFAQAGAGATLPDEAKKKMADAMRQMMGEEMNAYMGVHGKSVIQVTAKDWESAQKLLDQYTKGQSTVADEKTFAAARKELPEQASMVILIDAVQYTGVILEFMKPILESSGAPIPAKFPKPVKDKPGFVGAAVTLEPDRGAFDLSFTSDAVKRVYDSYISQFIKELGN